MNIVLLVLFGIIVLVIPASFLLLPGGRFPRVLATLALVGVLFFCIFGFLASYEYSEPSKRLPWQIGYGAIGVACLSGAFLLLRGVRRITAWRKRKDQNAA
jgi:hypothetical protein